VAGERTLSTLKRYRELYSKANRKERSGLLDEFCELTQYHRKYAISLLSKPADAPAPGSHQRKRGPTYSATCIKVLEQIWQAAGRPWSERLKGMLPYWLPWARGRLSLLTPAVEAELLAMSPRQMDRRLQPKKRQLKKRMYGRTKPGSLLKHQIAVKTEQWDVDEPGFFEIDLVSHSGPHAAGEFLYSLNITDIYTGWCETRAIMGRGETGVVEALDKMRAALPFTLKAIDCDNGSEFINHHLMRYCQRHGIQFTRGRPYRKNDNAHVEQKNWTHVRKLVGWDRYDTAAQQNALNELYEDCWGPMMNLYQPCVKLKQKVRIGSRVTRRYDQARTPLDRLAACYAEGERPASIQALLDQRGQLDPFALAETIEKRLEVITQSPEKAGQYTPSQTEAGHRRPKAAAPKQPQPQPPM